MLQKVAVVVLHSPFKLVKCWKCSKETSPAMFCESCHSILDYRADNSLSHFEVLQVKEALIVEQELLRNQFYALSKKLHPDRFANQPHPAPVYALRWTTALNRAYQTLKNRDERTRYLVEKYLGAPTQNSKPVLPLEMAETYFESLDSLSEGNKEPLLQFKLEIEKRLKESGASWEKLAKQFDESLNKIETAQLLRKHETEEKYFRSMLADIERKVTS